MVAIPQRSLLGMLAAVVVKVRARRRERPRRSEPGVVSRLVWWLGWWLAELLGTVVALGLVTFGAFAGSVVAGWIVAGVCVLVLDLKVETGRAKRRAER
jgi:anti-sigma factor RsiW